MTQAGLGTSFAPKSVMEKIPALGSSEDDGGACDDKLLVAHWFSPYSGWDWYVAESDGDTCFGFVAGSYPEWGYFSLKELEAARGMGGKLPLVEREVGFEPTTLRKMGKAQGF